MKKSILNTCLKIGGHHIRITLLVARVAICDNKLNCSLTSLLFNDFIITHLLHNTPEENYPPNTLISNLSYMSITLSILINTNITVPNTIRIFIGRN